MLTLALLLSLSSNIEYQEHTRYYDISGTTINQMLKSIQKNRPAEYHLGNFDAYTDYKLHYGYSTIKSHGRCKLTKPKIRLTVTFVLPRWTSERTAPSKVIKEWHRYRRALIEHENGHKEIAAEAANAIESLFQSIPRSRSCHDLNQLFNHRASELERDFHQRQKDYDKATKHGILTGAVLNRI